MRILQHKLLSAAITAITVVTLGLSTVAPVSAAPNPISEATTQATQQVAQTTPDTATPESTDIGDTDPNAEAYTPEKTCESSFPGLGWLLCQITRGIYSLFNLMATSIGNHLLKVDLIGQEAPLKAAWNGFRSIANIIFVVAFLIIIYAQAIGKFGMLEAYSLQRILPRLVLSVIGIQLSFFIVGYTIGFFNDLGEGIARLVLAPVNGWSQFELAELFGGLTQGERWFGIPIDAAGDVVDNILAAPAVIGVGLAAFWALPMILLFGATGLGLLLITLVARKIIIIGLVVLAPLAFAAYALPSTEGVFKQWWGIFWKTLAMYPLIMLLIASGQLLGRLIISGPETSFIDSIIGFIATFLPLFIIPATFKYAGAAVGALSGGLTKIGDTIKGDARDPESARSKARASYRRNWNRAMGGDMHWKYPGRRADGRLGIRTSSAALMPGAVRTAWARTPGTGSSSQLIKDLEAGREMSKQYAVTMGDDFMRAMAVTGGGRKRGVMVRTASGAMMDTGRLKLGKHAAFDAAGNAFAADDNGNIKLDGSRSPVQLKDSDFYDNEMYASLKRYGGNFGMLQASVEHSINKTSSRQDEAQVLAGLDAANVSKSEKARAFNGTWNAAKGDKLHIKFADTSDFFHEGSFSAPTAAPRELKYKYDDMASNIAHHQRAYDLIQQKSEFWEVATKGVEAFDSSPTPIDNSMSQAQIITNIGQQRYDDWVGVARKAQSIMNSSRRISMPQGDEGEENLQLMGSQATSHAADAAEKFLIAFHRRFGKLPAPSSIERDIAP